MEQVKFSRYGLGGIIGARLRANECNWLKTVPTANPGMLGMFATREDSTPPDLVPWAGEFIGKYLISAIQALRFSTSADLRELISDTASKTLACQSCKGYLGPFSRSIRLKANWDLWGHYHLIIALLLWHDESGEDAALQAAFRIGDLICDTFLDNGIRVIDAGSAEMNMAVLHGLGLLYLRCHSARYLAMMRQIEIDWEATGNYLRAGIEGVPFYATPHPRWESLHDIQGLAVLYRITGDRRYLQAFESHWRSILRWDVHNTGAFSTGEGAIGDPYTSGAIETCCTTAWIALTVDYLDITGDSRAADVLENSLYNAVLGSQHPDGKWWTYDTPMEGTRIPSFSALAFQARPDTPGLNCCSVNGPRGLTMLCDWAVTRAGSGLVVNYYGPGSYEGSLSDETKVKLEWDTQYPFNAKVTLRVNPERTVRFPLLLRIPSWSRHTTVEVNGVSPEGLPRPKPGRYLTIDREWSVSDFVDLKFDLSLRMIPGDGAVIGKTSIYRGPLLLAYDVAQNSGPNDRLPAITAKSLQAARISTASNAGPGNGSPWLTVTIPTANGPDIVLSDFASAGSGGTYYVTWLPAPNGALPTPSLRSPDDGAMVRREEIVLTWSAPPEEVHELSYHVVVSENADLSAPIINMHCLNGTTYRVAGRELKRMKSSCYYYWCVSIEGRRGPQSEVKFPARFKIAP